MDKRPPHIVIACSYLHVPAGYEKAMTSAANLFAEKGNKVTLMVLDHTAEVYFPLHPSVKILHAPMTFGITDRGNTLLRKWWMWKDIRKLKRLIRQLRPDHLLCSEYQFAAAAILAGAKDHCRVYSWEHHHYGAQQLNGFWRSVVSQTYPRLNAVICLNKDEQQHYLALNDKTTVIPNFITPPNPAISAAKEFDLISVTRFNHIKGIDLLMRVAKAILLPNPPLKWKVIGYGEHQDAFLDFIKKEKLQEQLIFQPANKTDLSRDYQTAGIFIMTSRNECFPLVLLEAMSHGLPCIAFDCETGPRHIIRQDITGLLVAKEDVNEMAAVIVKLVNDTALQQQMSENARQTVQDYYPDKVYTAWANLFNRVT